MLKISNFKIKDNVKLFAYDGCHKIYLLEDEEDLKHANEIGYTILPITKLKETYENSCSLRFINNWKLTKVYAKQCSKVTIKEI